MVTGMGTRAGAYQEGFLGWGVVRVAFIPRRPDERIMKLLRFVKSIRRTVVFV